MCCCGTRPYTQIVLGGRFTPCLTRQGMVEAATHGGVVDASLMAQKLDGCLAFTDSLRTATRVHMDKSFSTYEALQYLSIFNFIALHLFSVGGIHFSAAAEILRLIERLEEIHTKVRGVISSPHLATHLSMIFHGGGATTLTGVWLHRHWSPWRRQRPRAHSRWIPFY